MKRPITWSYQWMYYLTVVLLYAAVVLRSLLIYSHLPVVLSRILVLLAAWLVLYISEPAISRRWRAYFPIYLVLQTALVVGLLLNPDPPDYFAVLFAILSMRIMQQVNPRTGMIYIAAFTPLTAIALIHLSGVLTAAAFSLVYTSANALFGFFSLAARRAEEARHRNQAMLAELQETNRQLQDYSRQLELLAVARERNRLARELHDSVTQTVFSMTLTTQSALLLLDREASRWDRVKTLGDPAASPADRASPGNAPDLSRVKQQLDHLNDLANSALAEMQTLISELRPGRIDEAGLESALRQHLAGRSLPEGLSAAIEVEGKRSLGSAEERGLFRIIQEALNNVVKHSGASRACIRLHLAEPAWVEIEDNGRGFAVAPALKSGGVGLSSMSERAAEIGWDLQLIASPGAGTRIRIEEREPRVESREE